MSKLIHNIVGIILMVIVVILAHPLPCSANSAHYYGKSHGPRRYDSAKKEHALLRTQSNSSHFVHDMEANDPTKLFEKLDKFELKKNRVNDAARRLQYAKQKEKLIYWLNHNNGSGREQKEELRLAVIRENARQLEQQQRRIERIQNEAADREFERMMKMNLHQDRTEKALPEQRPLKGAAKKDEAKKSVLSKSLMLCKKPKVKSKCQKPTFTTTTERPYTESSTTCPASAIKSMGKGHQKSQLKCAEADRLLQITKSMKIRALLIIKHLNLLEMEILSRNNPAGDKAQPKTTARPTTESTTKTTPTATMETAYGTTNPSTDPPPPPVKSDRESMGAGKKQERLDRPTAMPTTGSPFKHSSGFYFGFRPPGEENTEANMAAALREERKLEQKVREELQMQRESMRSERQEHIRHRPQDKRKRARYEAAPPAAARLELIITTPSSMQMCYPRDDGNGGQKIHRPKQPAAAVKSSADNLNPGSSRNQMLLRNGLASYPIINWKKAERSKRMRHKHMLTSPRHQTVLENCLKPQIQRHQRYYNRPRHRKVFNSPNLALS
ncbi:uncharacterized protein LOC135431505 [Drosophila montana]|uniref:uncharacterized protein LOC135431505 n=1 Tax=Drosophila montana TaxID=40370 RepID=UPI00313DA0BD